MLTRLKGQNLLRSSSRLVINRSRSTVHRQILRTAYTTSKGTTSLFDPLDPFLPRHLGAVPPSSASETDAFPRAHESVSSSPVEHMLKTLNYQSLDSFLEDVIPKDIKFSEQERKEWEDLIGKPMSERRFLQLAKERADENKVFKSWIGGGYQNTKVPGVILRNLLENHAWFSSYTPYQPEISQGRLESLINFQTVATSLTGLAISNASLLDESTAAGEAMLMCFNNARTKKKTFLVDHNIWPQTLDLLKTRAGPFGIKLEVIDVSNAISTLPEEVKKDVMGVLVQYPDSLGEVKDWSSVAAAVHELGGLVCCSTDLLALTVLKPPAEWGCDIAFGNSSTFGVPLGYGGPHAAFFSCAESLKRKIPGRLIGLSKDALGKPAYRLALQTREQHIRREKATSNICTAQALLANMTAMYAVWYGPEGLRRMAEKVHGLARVLKSGLESLGDNFKVCNSNFFNTIVVDVSSVGASAVHKRSEESGINLGRPWGKEETISISVDETADLSNITALLNVFASFKDKKFERREVVDLAIEQGITGFNPIDKPVETPSIPSNLIRTSPFLQQQVFNSHHSETEFLRYMHMLQNKDLSLVDAMIPLGSCTMKLNSTTSMLPLSWPGFSDMHPFAPLDQTIGYQKMIQEVEKDLCTLTGLPAVSLQPNSGAAGEYAGLSVIRAYHHSRGDVHRDVCLVPVSAHGTNPASAIMAGMKVVAVKALPNGYLDLADLREKAEKYKDTLAAFMVTYPNTFGVFETGVKDACDIVHQYGGQVYLDGANMNAQMGLTNPGKIGADVCHLNLHKTLSIPHGGGGPGQGPICCASHLAPFLPGHPIVKTGGSEAITCVSAAPWGSASILTISWAFMKMLGGSGLRSSSEIALLNANYMAERLKNHYTIKFKNEKGRCAHEFIIDFADLEKSTGLKVMDFAKRLQDYGFHPPTCSWPISTCMLIEPTESESLEEIDRFCNAMIRIREEADEVVRGEQPKDNNIIKNAPHPIAVIALSDQEWNRPYSRERAVHPDPSLRRRKYWPTVGRLDDAYGDTKLICECPSVEEVAEL
ncbi:glycine dehydrogenase [Atractiella rhizophila]|nr:glycine dehydrogenase [Atractiella rhizophila]